MNKRINVVLVSLFLLVAFAVAVVAQQQGANPMSAMREKYKYTFQLMQMVRHIGDIDKDKKYTLTPGQAKQLVAVLKPLRTKPKMTQDEAKNVLKKLKTPLTANQLNAMARIKPKGGTGQGRAPSGGANSPRPNGQAGARRFDPNAMKDFNPFYTKVTKGDKRAEDRLKQWNTFYAGLEAKAKKK